MSTFVTLGNSHNPFHRLLRAVAAVAHKLPGPVRVQNGHTPCDYPHLEALGFMPGDAYEAAIAAADLVIMQAGGGGVLYAVRAGKSPIITPRLKSFDEIVDDHQIAWSQALSSTGRAILLNDLDSPEAMRAAVAEAQRRQTAAKSAQQEAAMVGLVRAALKRA
jgi:UDP-N-acetylglucosamine transferase subunit ALG13